MGKHSNFICAIPCFIQNKEGFNILLLKVINSLQMCLNYRYIITTNNSKF